MAEKEARRCLLALLMENTPGALSRVIGLFSQRGYNIDTLAVAPTEDPSLSRLTLSTVGAPHQIEQITKHLHRLIDVVKITNLEEGDYLERELMLIKVHAEGEQRAEHKRVADIFRAQIVDVGQDSYVIQITGVKEKLDVFQQLFSSGTILEVVRSGPLGLTRGRRSLRA